MQGAPLLLFRLVFACAFLQTTKSVGFQLAWGAADTPWGPRSCFRFSFSLEQYHHWLVNKPKTSPSSVRLAPLGARGAPLDAEEYLRLRNTVPNLSEFQGGQQLLQQHEDELLLHKGPLDAAANYQRIRALRQRAARQPRKKEIKLSARIAHGDLQQKARQARLFLEGKHQVKFTLQLRGRERLNPENHLPLLQQLQQLLCDVGQPAVVPQAKGPCSVLTLFLQPRKRQGKDRDRKQQQQQHGEV
ncbi:uncharacterized protein LOC113147027 [Cyclospora cayetanensis]|uniref:Uncharacterized protein LOC113147027 n=1 Tax=Cyclospora cayetanensis TaxID=88456 RepID=A0A6P6RVL7_9EIME|nr:uncharacterized protein LOC113147027 [Cyclospora cayetanensis]